jgi:hypothetical protein
MRELIAPRRQAGGGARRAFETLTGASPQVIAGIRRNARQPGITVLPLRGQGHNLEAPAYLAERIHAALRE